MITIDGWSLLAWVGGNVALIAAVVVKARGEWRLIHQQRTDLGAWSDRLWKREERLARRENEIAQARKIATQRRGR